MTEGDRPVDIRDRAILMLFATYSSSKFLRVLNDERNVLYGNMLRPS